MLFKPKLEEKTNGNYIFGFATQATVNACFEQPIFQEIWNGFCCHAGKISFATVPELVVKIGEATELEIPQNGYAMEITEKGISIAASDRKNLIYGFFTLLEKISQISTEEGKEQFSVACCKARDEARVKTRMVHLCVFPETTLTFIQKFLRTAAFLRYTHIIVEFWGMLQFDCLKELAWKHAFTKEQIRPLLEEAKALGVEIVPMLNHWGHASSCRVAYGKHVALDQNLRLAPLFDISGWNWNLKNPTVQNLHAKIRDELIELCGNGEYFHIGCDEPYGLFSDEYYEFAAEYINSVEKELQSKGRKAIMWGDMLLHRTSFEPKTKNAYAFYSPSETVQKILLKKISRSILIGDWEYSALEYPVETCAYFKEQGFEVLCCPWDNYENILTSVKTVKEYDLKGLMHTTWQTVASGFQSLALSATSCWKEETAMPDQFYYDHHAYLANVMRKLYFPNGEYENCGWTKVQIIEKLH